MPLGLFLRVRELALSLFLFQSSDSFGLLGDEPYGRGEKQTHARCYRNGHALVSLDEKHDVLAQARTLSRSGEARLVGRNIGLQIGHVLVAPPRIMRHGFTANGVKRGRNLAARQMRAFQLVHGIQFTAGHFIHDVVGVAPGDGNLQVEDLVKDCAQRIDVRPRIDRADFAARLLRRHVGGRPQHAAVHRAPSRAVTALRTRENVLRLAGKSGFLAQTPVHDQHFAEVADHDVFRLEIAVVHAAVVGERDRVANLLENRKQKRKRIFFHRLRVPRLHPGQHFGQRRAVHEFHCVESASVRVHTQLMHRHDIRMLEHAGNACFIDETAQPALTLFAQHDLHGHLAPHGRLARLVNRSHASRSHDAPLPVVADARRQHLRRDILPRPQKHIAQARCLSLVKVTGSDNRIILDHRSVAAVEIGQNQLIVLDNQLRVQPRHRGMLDADLRLGIASDDIFARREGCPVDFIAVDGNKHFGNHRSRHIGPPKGYPPKQTRGNSQDASRGFLCSFHVIIAEKVLFLCFARAKPLLRPQE